MLSPQHRVVLPADTRAHLRGEQAAICAVKRLVRFGHAESVLPRDGFAYHHFALGRHEMVFANGQLAETLHFGPTAVAAMNAAERAELARLDLLPAHGRAAVPARPIVRSAMPMHPR